MTGQAIFKIKLTNPLRVDIVATRRRQPMLFVASTDTGITAFGAFGCVDQKTPALFVCHWF